MARIKFPVDKAALGGTLFSKANIYPDTSIDNTYKILKKSTWFNDHVAEVEAKFGLATGTLGRVL